MAARKPVYKIRLGSINAAVWLNENGNDDVRYNVTIVRSYKDGNEWKDTTSFSRDDLPAVKTAIEMAYAWICDRTAVRSGEEN